PDGTETVLYSFGTSFPRDGVGPKARLIRDPLGNLYGTTVGDKDLGVLGTVFKLVPAGTLTVLHTFTGQPNDGELPVGDLARDGVGNLYGITNLGGELNAGTIFRLAPDGTQYMVLHSFDGTDTALPTWGLIRDSDGNLYGTTASVTSPN